MNTLQPGIEAVTAVIKTRRSIKPALMDPDRPIPQPLVDTLLENATWAPTHGMTEPWHFILFSGTARAAFGKELQRLYELVTPAGDFRPEKFKKLGKNPTLAPLVIAICVKRGASEKISETDDIAAVACAVQNMHLTAAAAGLGGFWSSPLALSSGPARQVLGLGEFDRCLGLFYVGWPASSENLPEGKRTAFTEKIRTVSSADDWEISRGL